MLLGIDTSGAVSVAVARGELAGDSTDPSPEILAVRSDMPAIMERYEAALQRLVGSGAEVLLFTTFDVKISSQTTPVERLESSAWIECEESSWCGPSSSPSSCSCSSGGAT